MNVAQLKEVLTQFPDDMEVWMQKDSEGNGYSGACGAEEAILVDRYDVYNPSWSAEDSDMTEEEWNEVKDAGTKIMVLWPVD